ncbi:MAG: ABC transporter permease [Candidatus Aminicenantes bacterium]|nr:MAG: ABC transporter permease [Candidatus Aminicenantes bacterium]
MKKIPRLLKYTIQILSDSSDWDHLQGDYDEIYDTIYADKGRLAAIFWVLRQIANASAIDFERIITWRLVMLKNYIKIALRNIRRQKLYSSINILGLAVGLASSILIFMWVQDEKSYDRFHTHADRIFRVTISDDQTGPDQGYAVTPIAMAPAIKQEIPEILYAARTSVRFMKLSHDENVFKEKGLFVSPDFLRMFSFNLLEGNPDAALSSPDQIVISEKLAQKHFGTQEALGRILRTEDGSDVTITGVFQNIPRQSHLYFDFLINFERHAKNGLELNRWQNISFYSYIMLEKGADPRVVAQKIIDISKKHLADLEPTFALQPLLKIHLDPPLKFDNVAHGSRQSVALFSIVALSILLIACFNFINLSTARSSRRALEVGLRKVIGARRSVLVRQFWGEALFLTSIAACLALLGIVLILPSFNSITGKDFAIRLIIEQKFLLPFLGITIFTGLASGSYPAFLLSSFQPAKIFRGRSRMSAKGSHLRKVLVVSQFALTVAILTAVLVTAKQLNFLQNKDLGYDKTNLMAVRMKRTMVRQREILKQKLLANPNILSASATANLPTTIQSGSVVEEWEGKSTDAKIHFKLLWVDTDYLETFGIELTEGRFFSKEHAADQSGFVLNRAAVKAMGLENPVGKRVVINRTEGHIIGVVKDFHFRSLHYVIEPVALIHAPSTFYTMVIKLHPNMRDPQAAITYVESLWKEFAPEDVFLYAFLEDALNRLYQKEETLGQLIRYFSALAFFVTCLGLVGIASFTTEQRTKEIGIRKVLGASSGGLVVLLLRDFVKWVVIANILALPVAYLIMSGWLQNYAYHIPLSFGLFFVPCVITVSITLLTVGHQTFRASLANPTESLRYE